jgi:glycolate oxidase
MDFLKKLINIVGQDSVLINDADKDYASQDKSGLKKSLPLFVIKVGTSLELIKVSRLCLEHKVPIVIRACGTGKSGGAIASKNAVIIDITRLNRILINKDDLTATVEPGVVLQDLKEEAKKLGLFYPPDPASFRFCSLGGNVAENASGPSTLKYGTTRDYFLGGQVLIGTGELIDFGKLGPKGVTGYDIASVLCGSEGTLGIFTKLILRLLPLPKSFAAAEVFFDCELKALKAVSGLLKSGARPNTLEYIDNNSLKALDKFLNTSSKYQASLIIECDASFTDGAKLELLGIINTLSSYGSTKVIKALSEEERKALWYRRSLLSEACQNYLGHKISEDIAVPLGKLLDLRELVMNLATKNHTIALFGHAGDGNLHVQIMFDDTCYIQEAEKIRHEILLLVLSLKGTLSAEHGIGLKKKSYLALEQSLELIELEKRIKKSFDPYNLLNPGKIFDV